MASYYDEHNCQPLGDGEQPNHFLHLARLLLDSGMAREWEMEYESLFNGRPSPPASEKVVNELPTFRVSPEQTDEGMKCPVCLKEYEEQEEAQKLPCSHHFHPSCILPWLQRTNTCPVCRHELPTDDKDYEEFREQKARQKQREYELETLHDSMFG